MREGRPSRTAEQNALFRALEGLRPNEARVCDDPLARHFLTWPLSLPLGLAACRVASDSCHRSSIGGGPGCGRPWWRGPA